jgi:AraC-like DNA-binding protein
MENKEMINKALEYIGTAWNDESLTLEKVAEHAGFSVSYFDRLFAENTGKSVMEYARIYKLTQSARILRTSDRSILDIALELGYSNPENYARAFRAQYGLSPSEYKLKHQSIALTWKDLSTGTVAYRFEKACPGLERVDTDELIDALLTADPLKFGPYICAMSSIDSVAYRLSGDDYITVEEYSADEMVLTLYCSEIDIGKYAQIAEKFPKYTFGFICGKNFTLPPDKYGLTCDKVLELYDYAYLKDGIKPVNPSSYVIRELTAGDENAAEAFSKRGIPVVAGVFRQKFKHGNNDTVRLLGMFDGKKLAGCALPAYQQARSIRISDIGGIFCLPEYDTAANREALWSHAIEAALKAGYLPTDSGTEDRSGACEKLGYTPIAKRYCIMRGLNVAE